MTLNLSLFHFLDDFYSLIIILHTYNFILTSKELSQPTLRRGHEKTKTMVQSICLRGRKRAKSPPMFIREKRQKSQKDDGLRILKK